MEYQERSDVVHRDYAVHFVVEWEIVVPHACGKIEECLGCRDIVGLEAVVSSYAKFRRSQLSVFLVEIRIIDLLFGCIRQACR